MRKAALLKLIQEYKNDRTKMLAVLLQNKSHDENISLKTVIDYLKKNGLESTDEIYKLAKNINAISEDVLLSLFMIGDKHAFLWACKEGYVEVVRLLLEDKRDPSGDDSYAIRIASNNGHAEVVRLLLQDRRCDPSANNDSAIQWSSIEGHVDVVRLLLQDKRCDPSADNNSAIQWAAFNEHDEVVNLLFRSRRVGITFFKDEVWCSPEKTNSLEIGLSMFPASIVKSIKFS